MKIGATVYDITVKRDGNFATNICSKSKGSWVDITTDDQRFATLKTILDEYKNSKTVRQDLIDSLCVYSVSSTIEAEEEKPKNDKEACVELASKLIKFFKEYSFEPSRRMLNTLGHMHGSKSAMKNYILNYFEVMDNPFYSDLKQKMNSEEMESILDGFTALAYKPSTKINTRMKIYYGAPGAGKTTQAMKESHGRGIVCNSSLKPDDLLRGFDFEDGKPAFGKSPLRQAMEGGFPIVLDEINLLEMDSIRFLQGLTDGKESFEYNGETLHIADGFQVIGTMNLLVGGVAYPVPDPICDRCEAIVKFSVTPNTLADSLM